jgi:class 3 adenylate cyclase/tetratricopeptide (TPR) repeat protein
MQCPRCQHENPAGQKFCGGCGTRLVSICPSCSAANPPGQKFCGECGTALGPADAAAKYGTPQSYTPKHLAEKILTSKAALEGERKQVTVLFADLKGSMELLAERDPEEARKILDPVLERMMDAVHRYEGTVNQVMGDGVMALFGAPLAHEDHAVRACYAALRMQESVARYAEEVFRAQGVRIQIRVGLNSGEVVVRAIGSDLHMDYTAVGQTTHLAARMEQTATPGTILLAPATLRLAEDYVQVESRGPVTVKGLPEPVDIHVLTGARAQTRLQAGVARGLTRFVGRDPEIAQIRRALDLAGEGRGQLVAVVGEPGVGKSRLFHEFTRSVCDQGWLILEAGSVSYGTATSYLPVINLLKTYCQIESRDDARKMYDKVTDKLLVLDRALEPARPAFLALLDLPVEDVEWQALDPPQRRQRTLDACKRLLLRESQVQPLLVVFEDLHWIDSETQALLDSLTESLPTARLLLLVNYRPEYQHGWGSKTFYTQLRIDPLPAKSADSLLQALLGHAHDLGPLKRLLVDRTQGNPFFLEESVRTLVETGILAGARGTYRLATALPRVEVPATVQAVLASRIDRLPPEEKRLLQVAAVVGKDVPFALLQAAAEEPDERLRVGLARLQAAEFLYEARLFPEPEYTFKHALTHDVAYDGMLRERRRALHGRIVDTIERLHEDRLAEHIGPLAHHADRGEQWDKAAAYGYAAGLRSLERSAYREAVTYLDQALAANSHLPETRPTQERSIDLRIALKAALSPLGQAVRAFGLVREGEALAQTLGDNVRLATLTHKMFHMLWLVGQTAEARRYGDMTLQLAELHGDIAHKIAANATVGQSEVWWGDWPAGEKHLNRVVDLLRTTPTQTVRTDDVFPSVIALSHLGLIHAHRGVFREGARLGEEAVLAAEALRHPFSVAYAIACLAFQHLHKGDLANTVAKCQQGISVGGEASIGFLAPYLEAFRGYAHILSGSTDSGLPSIRRAIDIQTSMGFRYGLGWLVGLLAEGLLMAGRHEEAIDEASRALSLAVDCGERSVHANCVRLLADIAAKRTPPSTGAEKDFRIALALASELGARPLIAHCHLGLGKLYWRTGQHEQAREHLTTAATMYREMDMTFWLEQAEAK